MLRLDMNILWTIINLLIIYFIVRKFLFKPVKDIIAARQAEIDKQYADAKAVYENANEIKKKYEDTLANVKKETASLVEEAKETASIEYEKIIVNAKEEAEKIIADAQKNADREQEKHIQQAQEQIADLVVAATAKIVASKQSAEADRELYNQFIAKTGGKCD